MTAGPEGIESLAVLEELSRWIETHRESMAERGLLLQLGTSPLDGRDKRSAWLDVEGAEHMGQLIVWDTGEAELRLAEVSTGEVSMQHQLIETRAALEQTLVQLVSWADRNSQGGSST